MIPDNDDPLEELRSRIRDTQDAAQRLAGEHASARSQEVPPAGWASPEDHGQRATEVQALVALIESLRELIPGELREQFQELARQVLLLARAIIDWWIERMEAEPVTAAPTRAPVVEDIPIT
jgi:hypothetical protein